MSIEKPTGVRTARTKRPRKGSPKATRPCRAEARTGSGSASSLASPLVTKVRSPPVWSMDVTRCDTGVPERAPVWKVMTSPTSTAAGLTGWTKRTDPTV